MSRDAAHLRRARPDDGPEVAEVWLRSRRSAVPAIPAPVHSDDATRDWLHTVVVSNPDVWVLEHAGGLIAVMVLEDSWVDQLYVLPEWSRRGAGSRLIEQAQELRPQGLQLRTFTSNDAARQFYERHGFRAVGSTDGDNEERAPDVHYVWRNP